MGVAGKLGAILAKIGPSGWTKGQRKHVANLIAAVNREHNRKHPGTNPHTVLSAKTHILRKCGK
jgi:hypothetical protein